ncbi:iron ABC transporter substrate-binding protein [Ornithinimicrobium sp. Arc0846-15]|nr:iron ABC transporter substrate-binding protein [Ornithinimicrobium laminariae]
MTARARNFMLATLAASVGLAGCSTSDEETTASSSDGTTATAASDSTLTLYSGRNEELVQPVLDDFTAETGIEVKVRYGNTAEIAAQLLEEGDNSPADLFLAQDAGALGAVASEGMLTDLPAETLDSVSSTYQSADGSWVGVTGRARVLIYNERNVDASELPDSVFDLVEPEWEGRVGVAPTNASFQSFVTAMRVQEGDEVTEQWLSDLAANDPQIREKNGMIVADVNDGAIDVGLVNHYYLFELADEQGVEVDELDAVNYFFEGGDTGGLVNISGVGLVGEQSDGDAQALVDYLLSTPGQEYFRSATHEYPLVEGVDAEESLPTLDSLDVPDIDLNDLEDLQTTVQMISEAGLS